jgi:RNA polymerase sigma-70 factor, ECF subfamily
VRQAGQSANGCRQPLTAVDAEIGKGLIALVPQLRAYAQFLGGNRSDADDLAQEALAKAWAARGSFTPGTNLKAWLFAILRNQHYSQRRRDWRQIQLSRETAERILIAPDTPEAAIALDQLRQALAILPVEQREAIVLVAAGGFSYEEAADLCQCALGTMKSRVSRARESLSRAIDSGTLPRDGKNPSDAMLLILSEADRLAGRGRVDRASAAR